jgi:hypothetical protein
LCGDVRSRDCERFGHRADDPPRDGDGAVGVRDALDHHGELVAPEAGTGVLRPDGGTNALGDRHEELVPCCVTEAVVHRREVVEVDEEDGNEIRATDAALERVRDALREERAVRETRQRVVKGLVGQLILERSPLGDVARRDDDAADVGHSDEVVEHALELDERAVLAAERQVARHRSARDGADLREEASEPIGVVRSRRSVNRVPTSSSSS